MRNGAGTSSTVTACVPGRSGCAGGGSGWVGCAWPVRAGLDEVGGSELVTVLGAEVAVLVDGVVDDVVVDDVVVVTTELLEALVGLLDVEVVSVLVDGDSVLVDVDSVLVDVGSVLLDVGPVLLDVDSVGLVDVEVVSVVVSVSLVSVSVDSVLSVSLLLELVVVDVVSVVVLSCPSPGQVGEPRTSAYWSVSLVVSE